MSDEITFEVDEGETLQTPSLGIFESDENERALIDYISRELEEAASDSGRTVRMERNKKILRQRLAQPESETKDYPWADASNVSTPLALQKTNVVATKLLSSFMSKKPLFVYTSYDPKYKGNAEAITRHIQKQVESPYGINLYRKLWEIIYNAVSLGSEFVKVPFTVDQMKFNRLSDDGLAETVDRVTRATPDVIPLEFEDFLTRYQWSDIQRAPWIAIRHVLHSHEIRQMEMQGFFSNVELILQKPSTLDEHKVEALKNMGVEETGAQDSQNYPYEIFECYVRWDADGDGFDEDIIIYIEKTSKTILRAEYNDLGLRPVMRLPYIPIPGQLYGLGVGDIVLSLQDEADTLHNMRIDSTHLSIMPFVISSESSSFGQSMELFPGKWFKTAVPKEDIIIHKFPGVGPEAMAAESQVQQLADDATGASQALSGQDVGGYNRIGATGTQFLASQSNGYLDTIATQMGFALGELGLMILYQNVKNSELLDLKMLSESDQLKVKEVYSMNVEDIPGTFQFTTKVSAIADSRGAKQQEAMQVFQIYNGYLDKIIQLGASRANPEFQGSPQVMEALDTGYVGLTQIMKDVLRNYDEENIGDYLPFVKDLELQLRGMDTMREQQVEQVETGISEQEAGVPQPSSPADNTGGTGGTDNFEGAGAGSDQGTPESAGSNGGENYQSI